MSCGLSTFPWAMVRLRGSLRVMVTAADLPGPVSSPSLRLPLRRIEGTEREILESLLAKLELR
jgi:hypothetical protein